LEAVHDIVVQDGSLHVVGAATVNNQRTAYITS
jgi:hypothetical protein